MLALRARGGAANDGRAMGSFIDECVRAIPAGARPRYRLWIRVDSAGYQQQVIEAAERHDADFSVTVKQYRPVLARIHALALDPDTVWVPALGAETERGSEIAETTTTLMGRTLRLIVRRQPKAPGEQLAFDDLDGWRLHAIITNVGARRMTAAEVEAHHRLRGGIPEDTIRALKNDFGMIHAPVLRFPLPLLKVLGHVGRIDASQFGNRTHGIWSSEQPVLVHDLVALRSGSISCIDGCQHLLLHLAD